MLVKNNMDDFSFSKIIVELKDFQASERPHHLSMTPFYFKRNAKNLT
jgi:hypothetical protein